MSYQRFGEKNSILLCILLSFLFLAEALLATDSTSIKPEQPFSRTLPDSINQIKKSAQAELPELSMGDVSYADKVILYDPGALGEETGDEPDTRYQNPLEACGPVQWPQIPDSGFVSLGRRGSLVLKFEDNVLFDASGPDLCIIQGYHSADTMMVWISSDGRYFIPLGEYHQQVQTIDIQTVASPNTYYSYVKIRDHSQRTSNESTLGVDIDAVAAINTAKVMTIDAAKLFETNSAILLPTATSVLDSVSEQIRPFTNSEIRIEVFSDNQGAEDYNLMLTQQQAGAIQSYLMTKLDRKQFQYAVYGWGSQKPSIGFQSASTKTGARAEFFIQKYPLSE